MLLTLFLGKRKQKEKPLQMDHNNSLLRAVAQIQGGDERLRNELLDNYKPFIGKCVAAVCKRYISQSSDEEFSVGLEAFNEAITRYDSTKGSLFLSFAGLVIRRRVIDYIRKNKRKNLLVPLDNAFDSTFTDRDQESNGWDARLSLEDYHRQLEADYRREEVQHYKDRLEEFGIELEDLPYDTPSHTDARQNMIQIAAVIAELPELREFFLQKKKIPVKRLMEHISFSRKTIERNRNYIVAITIILLEDYRYLRSYIQPKSAGREDGAHDEGSCAKDREASFDRDGGRRGIL
ncbi:RNA polymerase sigma-I factor [Aneurinibacillus sp. Ricciae_BoGa-3]|uniref:RNA polymerase sigma-I factor n=1 Tax=Aneurinibacillus sp. Ricciae_BoGa-3 TaxID=3022697 RepID=UPI0023404378|nr:RNA polymerase sigma-I factor [Aneurinibacillus sp. Ricciae_BoGa-3]WCK53946.1 RNA polymerase sigma-I factor [Aneurinibacillus sp. Ricciae_BoGa-3]